MSILKTADFDYCLPGELIAQDPLPCRDQSRLMVVRRESDKFEHKRFKDIVDYLRPGDVLVLNDTRVIPARLWGIKEGTGGQVEVLLLTRRAENLWEVLVRPGRRARAGTTLIFGGGLLQGVVLESTAAGGRLMRFESTVPFDEALERIGKMPLPPYIKKYPEDPGRYQTVYARKEGSVAAPTAGLHFTGELLESIRSSGVRVVTVLLHVGLGTFRPVQVEDVHDHHMHGEYYEISQEAADAINGAAQKPGSRVIAVGTTTVRCLESGAAGEGRVRAGSGLTDIFIYPGYRFKVVQGMVTNFHLPRSTLIMMVSAMAGRERVLSAYRQAVEKSYRFFSFGDAMIIL
ncbi:MAG: tRNA preQ1(34) S-adenosylmethionine ribosyltransferase-isomerase QueA [Firmicutes bacterium]|nr:tRNA preQ1(34) S-adenosylmethionine ribosyltransferase-isomerase QueA [Bacillota bacterium]MCL5057685.1 tRNA preQ1(34) S-adenosylmethionine ribosyltransferase-isomerase QueA [Actinomycetota bacterium]